MIEGKSLHTARRETQNPEAIGTRILGTKDPGLMSVEEFDNSPEILFHGSARPFKFSKNIDYQSQDYLDSTDGSMTLGFGLYATDERNAALNYSVVRQNNAHSQIIATPLLPFNARVLDMRRKDDITKNAPVSREFAEKWRTRFLSYLKNRKPREENLGKMIDGLEVEYADYLNRVLNSGDLDLRVLLQTGPSPILHSSSYPAPPWALLFPVFMREEGYDGLVYVEGGEGERKSFSPSFVFYNLEKIGTYESWNKGKSI